MILEKIITKFVLKTYELNLKNLKLRGAYRSLQILSCILPSLKRIPISFKETGETYVDVNDPDTFWILNHYLGDVHASMNQLYRIGSFVISPGDTVWDVGANMGFMSWYFSQEKFSLNEIHLFEPLQKPFAIASDLLGGIPRVKLHNIGLGDKNQSIEIYRGVGSGNASIKINNIINNISNNSSLVSEVIHIKRGDDIIKDGESKLPSLIKIDVEGYECEVLRGIQEIIKLKQPVILFEILFLSDDEIENSIPNDYNIAFINEHTGNLIYTIDEARKVGVMDAILAPRNSQIWEKLKIPHYAI
jgi:FkbM family methyltransferase